MRKKLFSSRWFLWVLVVSIPLPVLACQFGWIAAEVGRQPWIVYKLLRTDQGVSTTVQYGDVLFSIILFTLIYIFLLSLYLFVLVSVGRHL